MRIGIDIGGTKTEAVAIDDSDTVIDSVRVPTGYGSETVLATVIDVVRTLAARAGAKEITSIGVGIPGPVNPHSGRVEHAVNLGLVDWDLAAALREELNISVRVENDVNVAALGAYHLETNLGNALAEPRAENSSMAYLNLGTGLAAGIIINRQIWRGSRGVAGEIGHIPMNPSGALCSCGQRGCLETLCSGSGIARQWALISESPVASMMDAAQEGHPEAVRIRDSLFAGVATAVRMLALTCDVERVVLGGGVTILGDPLLDGVRDVLRGWAADSPFLKSLELDSRVDLLPDSFPVAPFGAALIGDTQHG